MSAKNFVFRLVQQLLQHVDDPATAATTLTAAAAIGATTVTVASIAGLNNGDTFRVGSAEDTEVNKINGAPSGSTVTLLYPLAQPHAIGASARRQITYDRGDPTEDGISVSVETDTTDVPVATRRTVFTRLDGFARAFLEGAFPAFTLSNFAAALGMLASKVTGAGTQASPYQVTTDGTDFGEDINASWTIYGILVDGSGLTVELHGVDMDHTAVKAKLARGQLGSIPFKGKAASQVIFSTVAPTYTVDASKKATKNKVFDAPSEVGIYSTAGGGGNTTLSAILAAGSTNVTCLSTANFAIGDVAKIGTADAAEIHIVDSITDATHLVLRTKTLRAFAIGAPIVEQTQTAFGGMSDDGLDLAIEGSVRDVKLGTRRWEAGLIPGLAKMSLAFMVEDLLLANIAYALAVPQSAIAGGRLPVGNNLGTGDITEWYAKGLTQDGGTVLVDLCGCSQLVENFKLALNNKDIAKLPIKATPASCLTLRTY